MDKISGLPDELLVKILSFVPTKVAVSSRILSKRWEFLWMCLPELEYITEYANCRPKPGLREFIDKNLPLHRAPVIESLRLDLIGSPVSPKDIKPWVEFAVSRYIHELEIAVCYSTGKYIFPSSFYTYKSLVIFKLSYGTLMDVPSMVCLPSLKTLHLNRVKYADEKSLQQLLSICPVLENLSVHICDNVKEFTIIVPSLQSLSLFIHEDWFLDGNEIDTPSLKYLKLKDCSCSGHYYSLIKNMPKLREAHVDVVSSNLPSVIGSITSVKRLTICSEEDDYGDGFVFNQLEHLTAMCLQRGFVESP